MFIRHVMDTSHCILSLSFGNMTERTFSIKTALHGCGVPTLIDYKVLQFSRVILVAHSEPMKTWNFFLRDSTGTFHRAISLFSLPRMRTLYHSSEISSHASNSRTFCAAREFSWKVPSHILMSSQTFELRVGGGASSNISPLVCAALRQHSLRSLTFPLCMPQHSFECVSELFFSLREPSSLPLVKGKNMKTHFPIQNIRRRKSIHVLCWKCDRTKTRDFLIFRAVEFAYYDSLCRFFSVLCANHEVLAFCVPLLPCEPPRSLFASRACMVSPRKKTRN